MTPKEALLLVDVIISKYNPMIETMSKGGTISWDFIQDNSAPFEQVIDNLDAFPDIFNARLFNDSPYFYACLLGYLTNRPEYFAGKNIDIMGNILFKIFNNELKYVENAKYNLFDISKTAFYILNKYSDHMRWIPYVFSCQIPEEFNNSSIFHARRIKAVLSASKDIVKSINFNNLEIFQPQEKIRFIFNLCRYLNEEDMSKVMQIVDQSIGDAMVIEFSNPSDVIAYTDKVLSLILDSLAEYLILQNTSKYEYAANNLQVISKKDLELMIVKTLENIKSINLDARKTLILESYITRIIQSYNIEDVPNQKGYKQYLLGKVKDIINGAKEIGEISDLMYFSYSDDKTVRRARVEHDLSEKRGLDNPFGMLELMAELGNVSDDISDEEQETRKGQKIEHERVNKTRRDSSDEEDLSSDDEELSTRKIQRTSPKNNKF